MVFQLPSNVTSVIVKQKHPKAYRPTKVLYMKVSHLAATFAILKEGRQNCWGGILKISTKTLDLNVMNVATRQEARKTLDITLKPGIGKNDILVSWWPQQTKDKHWLIKHSEQVVHKGMMYLWLCYHYFLVLFFHNFQFHHGMTNWEQPSFIHLIFPLNVNSVVCVPIVITAA